MSPSRPSRPSITLQSWLTLEEDGATALLLVGGLVAVCSWSHQQVQNVSLQLIPGLLRDKFSHAGGKKDSWPRPAALATAMC